MELHIENIDESKILTHIQYEIYGVLRKWGALTRNQICDLLGLKCNKIYHTKPFKKTYCITQHEKRTTVYDNIAILMQKGYVTKYTRMLNDRGRPTVFFVLKDKNLILYDGSVSTNA